jgi:murein DD-endopeptidase MepM/ murein hydrolase activator NlpD
MHTTKLMHLDKTYVDLNELVFFNQPICEYGNTGFSTAPHLHIGVIKGHYKDFTMLGIENGQFQSDEKKLYDLVNNTLMNGAYRVTTRYLESGYKEMYGQGLYEHWGLDLVSLVGTRNVKWSSHSIGKVVNKGYNSTAGNFLVIQFNDDITGHWAEDVIKKMIETGRMRGYPDGTFQPDKPITRAEYAMSEINKKL